MRAGQPVKHFLQSGVSAATQGHKLLPQAAPGHLQSTLPTWCSPDHARLHIGWQGACPLADAGDSETI